MPGMLSSSRPKEHAAQLALLAFHEGVLSGAQLRRCVRVWVEETDSSLVEIVEREIGGADQELLANLKKQLAKFHPEHALPAPHFSFDAHQPDEQLVDAPTSVHNSVVANSTDTTQDEQRLGDEELSQKSKRNKSRSSRGDGFDYYDSVHEKFTRDERLMPYLVQSVFAYRRKVAMDLRRFWRSTKSLLQNVSEWFIQNRRNASLAGVGILLFVPACYLLSQFISPNRTQPERFIGQNTPPLSSASTPETEQSLDVSSLGLDEAGDTDSSSDLADEAVASQTTPNTAVSSTELVELAPSEPSNKLTPTNDPGEQAQLPEVVSAGAAAEIDSARKLDTGPPASPDNDSALEDKSNSIKVQLAPEPTVAEQLAAELKRGADLIDRRQFGRASMLLKSAQLSHADSKELCQMLTVAFLASQSVEEAGDLLVQTQFADAEDPVWQALFTCWLLQSTESSRASVKGELRTLVSLRPPTDIIKRCVAWIDARDGKHRAAGPALLPDPIFTDRSFADALFFCVALNGVGQPQLARKQLEYAKTNFTSIDKKIRQNAEPKSPAMYAMRFVSATLNSTLNSFDAKLP